MEALYQRWQYEKSRKCGRPDIDARWAKLPQEMKDINVTVRDVYRKRREDLYLALKNRVEREDASESSKAALMDKLRIAYESNQVSGPYFPLSRSDNYYVTVYNPDGEASELLLREK